MKGLFLTLAAVCLLLLFGAACVLFGARMAQRGEDLVEGPRIDAPAQEEHRILPLSESASGSEQIEVEWAAPPESPRNRKAAALENEGKTPVAPPLELRSEPPLASPGTALSIPTSPSLLATQPPVDRSPQVFLATLGAEFHRPGCSRLKDGQIPTTLDKALQAGYSACTLCDPLALKEPSVMPPGYGSGHKVFVPKTPRGDAESMEMLLRAMDQAPNAFSVELSWSDPFTLEKRYLEYRRDIQAVRRWDANLWEQWEGIPVEALLAASAGDSLSNWGRYSFYPGPNWFAGKNEARR